MKNRPGGGSELLFFDTNSPFGENGYLDVSGKSSKLSKGQL